MGKKNDDGRPKRPMSSYMLFANDIRAKLKSENPDAPITEIAKLTGAAWKECDEATKKKFEKKHKAAMAKYNEEIADLPAEAKKAGSKRKKDPNAPKRPMSGYMLFCNANRKSVQKKNPSLKMTELSGVLGKMWKSASASEKKSFQAEAAKAKKKYDVALRKYKETPEYAAFQGSKGASDLLKKICKAHDIPAPRGKKAKFPKDPNAPKRASSAFFLWSGDQRPKLMKKHGNNVAAVGKALGAAWKNIDAHTKAKYQTKADKAKTQYTSQFNKYQKSKSFKKYEAARKDFNKQKKKL